MKKARDPYEVLGLSKHANNADIKKAYRNLAKQYHPDQNKSDPEANKRFAEINSAYQILGNSSKRKQYDAGMLNSDGTTQFRARDFRAGSSFFENDAPFGFGSNFGVGANNKSSSSFGSNFDDFLSGIFGQRSEGQPEKTKSGYRKHTRSSAKRVSESASKDLDIHIELHLTVEEVVKGGKVRVDLPDNRSVNVVLKKGVKDRQQLRLNKHGKSLFSERGDVVITIRFRRDGVFRPEGCDLYADLPISLEDAVLGGTVRATTPYGAVELKISPNSTEKVLRLRNQGLPVAPHGSIKGDLYISPRITLPEDGDEELTSFLLARSSRRNQKR